MKVFLVINKNKNMEFEKYSKQFQIFEDKEKAISTAKEIGFKDIMGMGICEDAGMLNIYKSGDVDVSILPLEIK